MVSKHALISVLVVAGSTLMSACDGDGDNRSFDATGGTLAVSAARRLGATGILR